MSIVGSFPKCCRVFQPSEEYGGAFVFVAACVWAGALSPLCCRDGGVVGGRSEAGASGPTARQPPLPRSDVQFMETAPRPSVRGCSGSAHGTPRHLLANSMLEYFPLFSYIKWRKHSRKMLTRARGRCTWRQATRLSPAPA